MKAEKKRKRIAVFSWDTRMMPGPQALSQESARLICDLPRTRLRIAVKENKWDMG
jgi:hypothetical protein